jgi:urease accessory protein
VDHLAAMLAVGMWSALAIRPLWLAPTAFLAVLCAGALAGFAGIAIPAVEPLSAASLLVFGLLLSTRQRLPFAATVLLVGGFAFFHGAAHGAELARDSMALLGMVAAGAFLHASGIAIGRLALMRSAWLRAAAGAPVMILGTALLLQRT